MALSGVGTLFHVKLGVPNFPAYIGVNAGNVKGSAPGGLPSKLPKQVVVTQDFIEACGRLIKAKELALIGEFLLNATDPHRAHFALFRGLGAGQTVALMRQAKLDSVKVGHVHTVYISTVGGISRPLR